MKHKNIFAIMLALSMSSCSFLQEDPKTSLSPDEVYSSEEGVRSVLMGCYGAMTQWNYRAYAIYELSVNSVYLSSKTTPQGVIQSQIGAIMPNNINFGDNLFSSIWGTISRTNDLIDNIEIANVSEEVRTNVLAEAKFLRAVSYFDLVRLYGSMPLVTKPILTPEQSNVPRSSIRETYDLIIKDFEEAYTGMPVKGKQLPGHPHREAAKAYLAKVYLQMASLTDDHLDAVKEPVTDRYDDADRDSFYQLAYDYAEDVVESGTYSLLPTFGDLWNNKVKNSNESIFEMQFGRYGSGGIMTERTLATNKEASAFTPKMTTPQKNAGRVTSSKMLLAEHWERHGNGTYIRELTSNIQQGCDPRINDTYLFVNDRYIYDGVDQTKGMNIYPKMTKSNVQGEVYPYIRKFWYDDYTGIMEANFMVYRFADLLLVMAEAANELENTSKATELVNRIRTRARGGISDKPVNLEQGLTQAVLREEIRWERVFELVGEGQEMFEVRRHGVDYLRDKLALSDKWVGLVAKPLEEGGWNLGETRHKTEILYGEVEKSFLVKNLFYPYPAKEIQLNDAIDNSDQNLGWENF